MPYFQGENRNTTKKIHPRIDSLSEYRFYITRQYILSMKWKQSIALIKYNVLKSEWNYVIKCQLSPVAGRKTKNEKLPKFS